MTLHLSLTKQWFQAIKFGPKMEEYREITPYWTKRLSNRNFEFVHFTLGYPKKEDAERHIIRRVQEIVVGTGDPEWGACPGKEYYIIRFSNQLY